MSPENLAEMAVHVVPVMMMMMMMRGGGYAPWPAVGKGISKLLALQTAAASAAVCSAATPFRSPPSSWPVVVPHKFRGLFFSTLRAAKQLEAQPQQDVASCFIFFLTHHLCYASAPHVCVHLRSQAGRCRWGHGLRALCAQGRVAWARGRGRSSRADDCRCC